MWVKALGVLNREQFGMAPEALLCLVPPPVWPGCPPPPTVNGRFAGAPAAADTSREVTSVKGGFVQSNGFLRPGL